MIFEKEINFSSDKKYELLCYHTKTNQTRITEIENMKRFKVWPQNIYGVYPYKNILIVIGEVQLFEIDLEIKKMYVLSF